ncbi:hypothetical protein [Paraburkholderia antibiotica]|uniref:hypothetical protein n=1 Tax=Paraburkholderia antibiotica TaxID=2728839 RepID=UPI002E34F104|nr:hypothetical protein [Paraburkholderia antibiotica]
MPDAIACATCSALSEPLNESGAITMTGVTTGEGDEFGMVSLKSLSRCERLREPVMRSAMT